MKIIISPAKTMIDTTDDFIGENYPVFIKEANHLLEILKLYDQNKLSKLLKANDNIVSLNYLRYQNSNIYKANNMAIMSYYGIQYQHLGAKSLDQESLEFLNKHLIILSALYGIVRPNDKIIEYRLEMQHKLDDLSLYKYWSNNINDYFKDELILDLASNEYSKVLNKTNIITVKFLVNDKGKLKTKATLAKMARGAFVRYIAINKITNIDELKNFNDFNFKYDIIKSADNCLVYIKEGEN